MSPVRYVYHKIKFDKCDSVKLCTKTHANTFFIPLINILHIRSSGGKFRLTKFRNNNYYLVTPIFTNLSSSKIGKSLKWYCMRCKLLLWSLKLTVAIEEMSLNFIQKYLIGTLYMNRWTYFTPSNHKRHFICSPTRGQFWYAYCKYFGYNYIC